MVDYGKAFKRPFDDLKTLVIGIIIMLIPIVNFLGIGFMLKCAKTAKNKNFKLPKWENFVDLFVKGLLVMVISFIYFIPALVIMAIAFASNLGALAGMATAAGGDPQAAAAALTGMIAGLAVWGIIVLVVMVLTAYFIPAAVVRYAVTGKFGDAFSLGKVWKKAVNVKYFLAWLVGGVYSFVLAIVLSFIPFLGGAIGGFIGGVTMYTLLGEAYSEVPE